MSAGSNVSGSQVRTVLHILVTELCERFAFYGFVGSLTYFFMTLVFSSVPASELNQVRRSM